MAANLSGRPRPRATRLRESINRLVIGNGDALLDNLQQRAAVLRGREDPRLAQQAEWIAECAREGRRWRLARACLALASTVAEGWQQARLRERAVALGRLLGDDENGKAVEPERDIVDELGRCPAVDPTSLAEIWYRLGQHYALRITRGRWRRPRQLAPPGGLVGPARPWRGPLAQLEPAAAPPDRPCAVPTGEALRSCRPRPTKILTQWQTTVLQVEL